MKAIELFLKYIQEPLLIELGEDGLAGSGNELSSDEAASLEEALKIASTEGQLTKMFTDEMERLPEEMFLRGFTLEEGVLDTPDDGKTFLIILSEIESWELVAGPGWLFWTYYQSGVGYPVSDTIFY